MNRPLTARRRRRRIETAAFALVRAWATDPSGALDAVPPLCEALAAADPRRFARAFQEGVNDRKATAL